MLPMKATGTVRAAAVVPVAEQRIFHIETESQRVGDLARFRLNMKDSLFCPLTVLRSDRTGIKREKRSQQQD